MSLPNTHEGVSQISSALEGCRSLFFIGIGGISMSALAELSLHDGMRVGGSDRADGEILQKLERMGMEIFREHKKENLNGYDAVIYTVAIAEDNPEYLAAKERHLPTFSRADYLGYLMMRYPNRVGISGMHGKSTTTAMCAEIFLAAKDPTVMCGANLPSCGGLSCRIGKAREDFLFEACEYKDSFLDFNPTLAVVLNIGMDHVDYFHSMEQIRDSFLRFAMRTGADGQLLYCLDCDECIKTFSAYPYRVHTFGRGETAEFTARNITLQEGMPSFDFCRNGEMLCRISLEVSGEHNIENALAAASAAVLSGISPRIVADALGKFSGAERRMQRRGILASGAVVYDDYGHHPDEIRATLSGAAKMGYRRILCAYQPHTYSRTAGLFDAFASAFGEADRVMLVPIYAARESNFYGVSSESLAEKIGEKASFCKDFFALAERLETESREGDLIIVMGAGDINAVFPLLKLF